ncbi:hypothetical protein MKEN_00156300 [Mycena kentingensis (nom. inval.)]|nr:hypothetical protein MKEN_00156300 [Mycena kentingensis (nom. inval.)]
MSETGPAFPEELLLGMFQHLEAPHELRSILATSRQFARIAHPLAFSAFTVAFHGYDEVPGVSYYETLALVMGNLKQKMDFFLSARTAPGVRSCVMTLRDGRQDGGSDPQYQTYPLLDYLLTRIGSFSGLRSLRVYGLALSSSVLPSIQGLRQLRSLDLEGCIIYHPRKIEPLRPHLGPSSVEILRISRQQSPLVQSAAWTSFISPHRLVELSAPLLSHTSGWWSTLLAEVHVLPRLSKLVLFGHCEGRHNETPAIVASKFPAVQELRFLVNYANFEARVAGALCSITTVRRLVAPLGAVSRTALSTLPLTHYSCRLPEFLQRDHSSESILQHLSPSSTLTSLALFLDDISLTSLTRILGMFPHLVHFRLDFHDYDVDEDEDEDEDPPCPFSVDALIWGRLRDVLPPNLSALAIAAHDMYGVTSWPRQLNETELAALRNGYLARFPDLAMLYLHGEDFLVSRDLRGPEGNVDIAVSSSSTNERSHANLDTVWDNMWRQ